MYIRVKTTPNSPRKSVQLVASVRHGNKVSQRIVRHVGIAMDEEEVDKLTQLARHIKVKLEHDKNPKLFPPEIIEKIEQSSQNKKQLPLSLPVNLKDIQEEQRFIQGIHDVYGALYEELGFNKIVPNPARNRMAMRIVRQVVLARIANPVSKRKSVTMLEKDFGISLNLDYVYKVLDKVAQDTIVTRIKQTSYQATRSLFKEKIDVIFFDATTLYFESFTEDELKQNGYSKDGKFNQPQVLLGLLTTKEGLPIGYEVFPGSTYEGHTLIPILGKIREQYDLDKVVFVADSGLFNMDNLDELDVHGYTYIVGARIKNMKKELTGKILDKMHYHAEEPIQAYKANGSTDKTSTTNKADTTGKTGNASDTTDKIDHVLLASFWYQKDLGRRLIVSHSEKRGKKDAHDRQKAIDKLMKTKDLKKLTGNYGYRKYIKVTGEITATVDQDKIKEAGKWDGLHGVITNATEITDIEILKHYRSLWQIEESFRVTKHDLKIRPIFHWKPERVKAHIAIAFIAYTLVRHMEYRVRLQYTKLSPEVIRNELLHVQASILRDQKSNKRYVLPSSMSNQAHKIYKVMGLTRSVTPYAV